MQKEDPIFTAADGLVYKKETIFKHKNKIQELKQNKIREKFILKKYEKDQRKLPSSDVKTPESFVHEYLTRQRNYAKYKHHVRIELYHLIFILGLSVFSKCLFLLQIYFLFSI